MQFNKTPCPICNQPISKSGAAYTSHVRMHVREGKAIEYKRNNKLVFMEAGINITDIEPYAKLGNDQLPGQPKGVWRLPDLKIELPAVDPSSYFITSGEAVKKAEKLVQDCYQLTSRARTFRDKLRKARGSKKFLETVRERDFLLVKGKDPRNKEVNNENSTY